MIAIAAKKRWFVSKKKGFIYQEGGVDSRFQGHSPWRTQKRLSGGEPLATQHQLHRPENRTPYLPHRQPERLTIELMAGTDPEIEPKTSRANYSDVFSHYADWPVWLTQNYDIASGTSVCVAAILLKRCLVQLRR